ncbi:MAG TPA: XRE family transcriptional regulator [Rhizomicrobium sp.]|nr:XRE family transcriptional regulator [Rhizomicrobium sp.]
MTGDLFRRDLPPVIPERIKEARESRGYTRESFGEQLGVSTQAIGQYEIGQHSPGPEMLTKIIKLTALPPAFFTSERRRRESAVKPNWRSLARMSKPDRLRIGRRLEWAADIVDYVGRFIELPGLNLPEIPLPRDWDDTAALERAAEIAREHWNLDELPIAHLAPTLETNGVILVKERVNCSDMDAVSQWIDGRAYVLFSDDKGSLPRENFDLAHELLHLLAHAHIEVTSDNLPMIERQANYFAGAFLLPRRTFAREVISTSIDYFLELKTRWRVSVQAMIYRCKDLGLLNRNQVSYLWRQIAQKNMRNAEPLDDLFEPERPTLLNGALAMLVENGVQTRGQIANTLKLNIADIESLAGTPPGFLNASKIIPLKLREKPHPI